MQVILIGSGCCIKARMRLMIHLENSLYSDIVRQQGIDARNGPADLFCIHLQQINMGKKRRGMYTSVRPAAAEANHSLSEVGAQGFVQAFLYGDRVGLYLPAVISRAIVGEFYKKSLRSQSCKNTFLSDQLQRFRHFTLKF